VTRREETGTGRVARQGAGSRVRRSLQGLPAQFWLLIGGTVVFNTAIAVGLPYETIFLTEKLGVSLGAVGTVWAVAAFAGLPMQLGGGLLADWRGRRLVLAISAATILGFYAVMAASTALWQVAVAAIAEALFGWPLYLIACNAMIADLVPLRRRPVAYSVWRAAINVGVVVGPLIGALLLASGLSYRGLFAVAAGGCGVFAVVALVVVGETRPAGGGSVTPEDAGDGGVAALVRGLGTVFSTRRFLAFSLAALLVLFVLGQFLWILPVYLTRDLGMAPTSWGALLALSGVIVAVCGPPAMRLTRRVDQFWLMAAAGALIAVGVGGAAFVVPGWPVVLLVALFALGEALFWPLSSTIVSEMAPPALRGTYMGAWTLVDCAGRGVGPVVGGRLTDRFGGRRSFAVALVVGLVGAGLFPLLRQRGEPRPDQPPTEPAIAQGVPGPVGYEEMPAGVVDETRGGVADETRGGEREKAGGAAGEVQEGGGEETNG
jgi:MFS family permease